MSPKRQAVNLRSVNQFHGTMESTDEMIRRRDYGLGCLECECMQVFAMRKCSGIDGDPTDDRNVPFFRCDIISTL